MAKAKPAAKSSDPSTVTITYDLFDLPTAQHKAGLAGLLLQIDSMKNRGKGGPVYFWDTDQPQSMVHVTFSEESITELFDDLYAATIVPGAPREKPFTVGKGAQKRERDPLKRAPMVITDKKGNERSVDGYVYPELTPALATLRHYLPQEGEWVKLWRDLIWQIVREGKKKAPYIKRASAQDGLALADGIESTEADPEEAGEDNSRGDGSTWSDLIKHTAEIAAGGFGLGKLSGALLLGAMEKNAESVVLVGRIDQNLLLHFWPITVLVFVPRFIDSDGETHIGRRNKKDKSQHFCVAIPEVSHLQQFLADYPAMLLSLDTQVAGFRPRGCLVDLPAECAFSFVRQLAVLAPQRATASAISCAISSVDYLHINKDGNNIKFLSTGRVAPDKHLAEKYSAIVGLPGEKPPFGSPLFRQGLMRALLDDLPWYEPFGKMFAEWPHRLFVSTEDPPKSSWFWIDSKAKLARLDKEYADTMKTDSNDVPADDRLALLIHRLARTYLAERAKQKSGIDPEKHKEGEKIAWDKVPKAFSDERRSVGESLFLEFRSRRDQAFVNHFAQTFFAVKQYVNEEQYAEISAALASRWEDVKTLTLMALSANS